MPTQSLWEISITFGYCTNTGKTYNGRYEHGPDVHSTGTPSAPDRRGHNDQQVTQWIMWRRCEL